MDYLIANSAKKVFIKLDENGTPITCSRSQAERFDYYKAQNLLNHLPKTLKNFHFKLEVAPEIKNINECESNTDKNNQKRILHKDYTPSDNVTRWVEKFGTCEDILNEAKNREKQLVKELEMIDKEFLDILHIIELENSKDLYGGWIEYKRIRENREKRRNIKDELLIVEGVLKNIDSSYLQRKRVKRAIEGLLNRKYRFRIIEDCDDVLE